MLGVRISQDLLDEVSRTILLRNTWSQDEPWTVARFIAIAIREKVRKMERSRRARPRRALVSGDVVTHNPPAE